MTLKLTLPFKSLCEHKMPIHKQGPLSGWVSHLFLYSVWFLQLECLTPSLLVPEKPTALLQAPFLAGTNLILFNQSFRKWLELRK